ncbi:MAG: hypothetical protein JO041_11100, partial [Acidobacteria bacterium]|nr:hypothetical protein [Acidobacteriota bacterium]
MKQKVLIALVLALLGSAMVAAHRQQVDAPASADALLYFVADSERELTRLPARFTRISDKEEIDAGNRIASFFLRARGALDGDNAVIAGYVRQAGERLAPYAQRKLPYRFHYIPDRSFINAFAVPGGHV